jgi:hypothetical protein
MTVRISFVLHILQHGIPRTVIGGDFRAHSCFETKGFKTELQKFQTAVVWGVPVCSLV